jgi:hypothetical protein
MSLSPPRLRQACFDDYSQIQELEALHLQGNPLPGKSWRCLWLDNPVWPRFDQRWPIGWVLQDDGSRIIGSLTNLPSLYHFRGRELVCANGRAWVVRPEYRGFALWLMAEYFSQKHADIFVNTTVNPMSAPVFGTLSARIPVGDWETIAYWVTRYRGFAGIVMEKAHLPVPGVLAIPAGAALWLKDTLFAKPFTPGPPPVVIAAAEGFDCRFDAFWDELVRVYPEKLLAVRDSRALSWHYAIPIRRNRLWVFTASHNGLLRAYCVLNRQDWGRGVRRMRLVDYQTLEPDVDLLPALLQAALKRCAAEGLFVLEHHGCGLPKMNSLDRLAPYRRKLPNWPFYYHVADPALAAELRSPAAWDPSSFDGDASLL